MKLRNILTALMACTMCIGAAEARCRRCPVDMFKKLDTNHDGVLSLQEFMAGGKRYTKAEFEKLDKNHDGKLDRYEFSLMHKKRHRSVGGIAPAPAPAAL